MIKLNKINLAIFAIVVTNILVMLGVNFLYIGTIFSFFTFLILPGVLLVKLFKVERLSFWETSAFIIGFSVSFLEFGGLFINILFPVLGIDKPLATMPLLIGFDTYLIGLLALISKNISNIPIKIPRTRIDHVALYQYGIPIVFPFLAAFGAISLNNSGINIYTMTLLGLIALYVLIMVIFHRFNRTNVYPHVIFMIALSLLFTTSLRSNYITGHDVLREYYVFRLTSEHNLWNIDFYRDAYNACLSITILPTILQRFLMISDMYIYKFIYQIIFALCPVIIFFVLSKYTTRILSFLAVFFFMSFPTFFNDMPMLVRQEIGFLFFGLLLYLTFWSNLNIRIRKTLFILFGVSIVVSHYSTNYVVIALFASLVFLSALIDFKPVKSLTRKLLSHNPLDIKNKFRNYPFVNLSLVLILIAFTIFWNTQFTKTSNNVKDISGKLFSSLLLSSGKGAKSEDVGYSIFFKTKKTDAQLLKESIDRQTKDAKSTGGQLYSKSDVKSYNVKFRGQGIIDLTFIGNVLNKMNFPIFDVLALLRQVAAVFLQLSIFLGILGMLFFKNRKVFDFQYFLLCASGAMLLVAVTVLPNLSVEYGLLRLFAQLLFVLSLPVVIATSGLFIFLKDRKRIIAIGLIAIFFFLNLTGFLSHVTGGYYPQMTLDNGGLYYDSYYIKKQDVSSAEWLAKNMQKNTPVQSDLSGTTRLLPYGEIFANEEIVPSAILKESYVYLPNINNPYVGVSMNGDTYLISSPQKFLDENKSVIYNNGSTKIYK